MQVASDEELAEARALRSSVSSTVVAAGAVTGDSPKRIGQPVDVAQS